MRSDDARRLLFNALHGRRKSVAQTRDQLKQRQIDVRELASEHKGAAAFPQRSFEITEIFRRAILQEVMRELFRFRLLVLVIEPAGDWMMGVVNLLHEVGHRQLQLMQPEAVCFVAWCKFQARPEIE